MTTRGSNKNPEILEIIQREHQEVQALFEQFQESIGASESEAKAKSISSQIFNDLETHTQLEEKLVYPRLKEQDEQLFYEASEEHHVADLLISEMKDMNVRAPEYTAKMMVLGENVRHHIEEEESEMFEKIRVLPQDILDQMAQSWQQQKQEATAARR